MRSRAGCDRTLTSLPSTLSRHSSNHGSGRGLPRGDTFKVWQSPCLVEKRLVGAIQPKERIPRAAPCSGYPIVLLAGRCLRREVDVHRAIGILLSLLVVRVQA